MLPNEIVLPVDLLNTGSTTDQTYTRADYSSGKSQYEGSNHALNARDLVIFNRTYPKENGNFLGVKRSTTKVIQDVTVLGKDGISSITQPMSIETRYVIPVGTPEATVLELRQRNIALQDDDATMDPLNNKLHV